MRSDRPIERARWMLGVCLLLVLTILTGCPRPLTALRPPATTPVTAASQTPPIIGSVDMDAFRTQASTINEISEGATVALIDAATGYTLAATVTSPSGGFKLIFSNGFRADPAKIYYLEALKGLKAGTDLPNRIGSPLARVRTLVAFRDNGWVSLSSMVPGNPLSVSSTTTALSLIASLRQAASSSLDLNELLGSLPTHNDPNSFTKQSQTGITIAGLNQATQLVKDALALDQDPVRAVVLDVSKADFNSFSVAKNPFSISFFSPPSAAIGDPVEVVGDNFDPDKTKNRVTFPGSGNTRLEVQVQEVSADRTRLKVVVPVGATNGPVSVQVESLMLLSPTPFMLASKSGHNVIDYQGNLYVSNYAFGTIAKVTPQGVTQPLVTNLTSPRGLTLGPDNLLYVANGDGKIYRIDPTRPAMADWQTVASGVTGAWGLAFSPSGVLYASIESGNKIVKIVGGLPQDVTASGLSSPRGLCFGPDPLDASHYVLFVANYGNDTVAKVDPDTGATATFKSGFSRPWSVALDTFGVMYVTNNAGNSVYSIDGSGIVRPFASVRSPGGIVAAPSGYLYVADNQSNRIYQIDTAGYTSVLAEGVSYPKGLVAATDGTFYVANSQNHTIIRLKQDGTVSTVARGLYDPAGLALDEGRRLLYVANYGNGTVSKVSLDDGSVSTYLRNLTAVSGIAYFKDKLYVYQTVSKDGSTVYSSLSEVQEYDVTTAPATQTRSIRAPLRNGLGIAQDPRAGNLVYVTQPLENFVTRIDPATGKLSRFADTAPDPEDVAVDANGYVYVACKGTSTTDDALQIFAPDGSLAGTLADPAKIDRPTAISYDATTGDLFIGNSSTGATGTGSIVRLSASDRATLTAVVSGLTVPTGFAFLGTTMFVAHKDKVAAVEGYASGTPTLAPAFNRTSVQDVQVDASGNVLTVGGGIIRSDRYGAYATSIAANIMGGTRRLCPDRTVGALLTGNSSTVYAHTFGSTGFAFKWQGMTNNFNNSIIAGPLTPTLSVTTYGGKDWLLLPSCGQWVAGLMKINLDPAASEAYQVASGGGDSDGPRGAAMDPATGKAWSITAIKAAAARYDTPHTRVEAANTRDISYMGYGAAFWGGAFYATIYSHHRIDRFDASTLNASMLSSGFGGPEI